MIQLIKWRASLLPRLHSLYSNLVEFEVVIIARLFNLDRP